MRLLNKVSLACRLWFRFLTLAVLTHGCAAANLARTGLNVTNQVLRGQLQRISDHPQKRYPAKPFGSACSDAERALDCILHIPDDEAAWVKMSRYIQTWPHTRPQDPFWYADIMTSSFIYAWSVLEQKIVGKGGYVEGEICGLDFCLLTYSQDKFDQHRYRTLRSCAHQALIEFSPAASFHNHVVQYRMVYQKGAWKLDGCCKKSRGRIFDVNLTPDELECALCMKAH